MSYTDKLIEFGLKNQCPGCQQQLELVTETKPAELNGSLKYCSCCGWTFMTTAQGYEFGSMPPTISDQGWPCALLHPEHRENWPQPEHDPNQPDEYSQEELEQELVAEHPHHYYILEDERCGLCGSWAAHKITEELNVYDIHPSTSALCCNCFEKVFGSTSHENYPKLTIKPELGVNK